MRSSRICRVVWLPMAATVLIGCGDDQPTLPCNGAAELCGRPFDQVSYPTTHNAMSSEDRGWILPNQKHDITQQLADGVRAMMIDLHMHDKTVHTCHGPCELGKRKLADELADIKRFFDENPREVLTLILESYVKGDAVRAELDAAGLLKRLHHQLAGQPWPTLEQMVTSDKRLVILTDRDGGAFDGYLSVWSHAWETHWSAKTKADFSCKRNRGKADNPLFIFNHFLTNPVALPLLAAEANANPFFVGRALSCQKQSGRLPNFVTVDFYSIGGLLAVVRQLNGL